LDLIFGELQAGKHFLAASFQGRGDVAQILAAAWYVLTFTLAQPGA
jgi:hypothetical protein